MAKWHGNVGYVTTAESKDEPGVWNPETVERHYYGDVYRNSRKITNSENGTNVNINISNQVSIVADPFAYENFHKIRYAEFMGALWDVTDIEVQRPRLIMTLGGVYNGQQT